MATSQSITMRAFKACKHLGADIPSQVAIFGYDDVPWMELTVPGVSTTQQPIAKIAQRACEILFAARAAAVLAANAAFLGERSVFLLAVAEGEAIGCGGIQPIAVGDGQETGPLTGEVKRMYVVQGWRRRGVGAAILATLEERAGVLGYRRLVLETGDRQPEAVALYAAGGWVRITPFGPYMDDPTSVCFDKWL